MKQVNVESSEILQAGDVNDVGNYEMENFGEIIQAITDKTDVLLKRVVSFGTLVVSPSIQVSYPNMYFSTAGYLGGVPASTDTVTPNAAGDQIGVYLKITNVDTTDNREKIQPSGSTYVRNTVPVVVKKEAVSSVVYTFSGGPGIPPPTPTLGPNDYGYIYWGKIVTAIGPVVSGVFMNTTDLWSFTGTPVTVTNHNTTHYPGAGDELPLALLNGGNPKGSDWGFAQDGDHYITMQSVLNMINDPASRCLVFTASSVDNTDPVGAPRVFSLKLNLYTSLEVFNDGGTYKLRVKYAGSGGALGTSESAARSDHMHANLTTLPFKDATSSQDVSSLNLGQQLGWVISGTPSNIFVYGLKVFWSPPALNSPKIECGYMVNADLKSVGVKTIKDSSSTSMKFFTGEFAFTYLDAKTLDFVKNHPSVGGAVTWTYNLFPNFPTSGRLHFEALVREVS